MKHRTKSLALLLPLAMMFGLYPVSSKTAKNVQRKFADGVEAEREASNIPNPLSGERHDGHVDGASNGVIYADIYNTDTSDPYNYVNPKRIMELEGGSKTYSLDFAWDNYDNAWNKTSRGEYFLSFSNHSPNDLGVSVTYNHYDRKNKTTASTTKEITEEISPELEGKVSTYNEETSGTEMTSFVSEEDGIYLGMKYNPLGVIADSWSDLPTFTLTKKEGSTAGFGHLSICIFALTYDMSITYWDNGKEEFQEKGLSSSYYYCYNVRRLTLPVNLGSFSDEGSPRVDFDNIFSDPNIAYGGNNMPAYFDNGDTFAVAFDRFSQFYLHEDIRIASGRSGDYTFEELAVTSNSSVCTINGSMSSAIDLSGSNDNEFTLQFLSEGRVTITTSVTMSYTYYDPNRKPVNGKIAISTLSVNFISYRGDESKHETDVRLLFNNIDVKAMQDSNGKAGFSVDSDSVVSLASDLFTNAELGENAFWAYFRMTDSSDNVVWETDKEQVITSKDILKFDDIGEDHKTIYDFRKEHVSDTFTIQVVLYDGFSASVQGNDGFPHHEDNFIVLDRTLSLTVADQKLPETIQLNRSSYNFKVSNYGDKGYILITNYGLMSDVITPGDIQLISSDERLKAVAEFDNPGRIAVTSTDDVVSILTIIINDSNANVISKSVRVSYTKSVVNYTFSSGDVSLSLSDNENNYTFGTLTDGRFNPYIFDIVPSDFVVTTDRNNVHARVYESDHTLVLALTPLSVGNDIVYLTIPSLSATAHLTVKIRDDDGSRSGHVDFTEGDVITYLMTDTSTHYLNVDATDLSMAFSFLSYDSSVLTVEAVSYTRVSINPLREGSTTVLAYYTDTNGRNFTGSIRVNIMESTPEVTLLTETDATGNIISRDDDIRLSLDTHGFSFHDDAIFDWKVDGKAPADSGENLTAMKGTLKGRLSVGTHSISLHIVDDYYSLDITRNTQLVISELASETSKLDFVEYDTVTQSVKKTYTKDLYLALDGDPFDLTVALDGTVNDSLTYNWSLSNDIVISQTHQGNTFTTFRPTATGDVRITVMVNVGRISDKWINSEITVHVIEVQDIRLSAGEAYYRPGTTGAFFTVMGVDKDGNAYDVSNMDATVKVMIAKEEQTDYTRVGNTLTFDTLRSGSYDFQVNYGKLSKAFSYEVTNFSLKRFVRNILPYLAILFVLIVGAWILLRMRKNDLSRVEKGIRKLEAYLKDANPNNDDKNKILNKAIRMLDKTISRNDYCVNSDMDEANLASGPLTEIRQILGQAKSSDVPAKTLKRVFRHLVNHEIPDLLEIYRQILEAHAAFEESRKKANKSDQPVFFTRRDKKVKENVDLTRYEEEDAFAEAYDNSEAAQGHDNATEALDANDHN